MPSLTGATAKWRLIALTLAPMAITSVACVVSTERLEGQQGPQGPQGAPGDSPWIQDPAGFVYYDDPDTGAELARFSNLRPVEFTGLSSTATIGGLHPEPAFLKLGFGSLSAPDFGDPALYGAIGVRGAGDGSTMILGTSDSYALGVTNEAISIDKWANVVVQRSEKSLAEQANNQSFRSGAFTTLAIANSGNGYQLSTMRGDGTAPTSIRGDAGGQILFQVEGTTPAALDPTPAMLIGRNGNVGVGTATPKGRQHIVGDLVLGLDVNDRRFIFTPRAGFEGEFVQLTCDDADGEWQWDQGLTVHRDGNVGIGTSSPMATLDVNGTARLAKYSSPPFSCDSARDGTIALTSKYVTCVCNGSAWVRTSDGTTACSQW